MTKWTPEELRAIAGAPATEIWIGTVRSALRHAADLTDAAHAVRDENERLRADLDSYMEAANGYMREVEAMRAERDALRKDAERYQWLAARFTGYDFYWGSDELVCAVFNVGQEFRGGKDIGAAIDTQLAQTGANDAG